METILKFLSVNPYLGAFVIIVGGVLLLSIGLIYLIAFFQGREISFWPPQIGKERQERGKASQQIVFGRTSDNVYLIPMFMQRPQSFISDLSSTGELWMMGLVLQKTIDEFYEHLQKRIVSGRQVRILITSPETVDMQKLAVRFALPGTTSEDFSKGFQTVLRQLFEMKRFDNGERTLQVRLMNFVPPFSAYIFPETGRCYVELYGYRMYKAAPKFVVSREETPEWYAHFVEQFEKIWKYSVEPEWKSL